MVAPRELVSINQACARAGVSRRTIYTWIATDKVDYVRTAGGAPRIYADSLFHDAGSRYRKTERGRV